MLNSRTFEVQYLFRRKELHWSIAWFIAFALLGSPFLLARLNLCKPDIQWTMAAVPSIILFAFFMQSGMKSCLAFREGMKEKT